jgi:hypothetical protein
MFIKQIEMVKVEALRDFPHHKKQIKKGDVIEAENYEARGLIIAQLAKRVKPAAPKEQKEGEYKRRDMRAEDESVPKVTRQVAAESAGRSNRGQPD